MKHRPSKHSATRHSAARHSLATPTSAKVTPARAAPINAAKAAPINAVPINAAPIKAAPKKKASPLTRRGLLAAVGAGGIIALSATVVRTRALEPAAATTQDAAGVSYPKDLPPIVNTPDLPEPVQELAPPKTETEIGSADRGPTRMVMIIRHGERPAKGTDKDDVDGTDGPLGWDPLGKPDTHSLTTRGWTRAAASPACSLRSTAGCARAWPARS
jgi:hypothetical protein